MEDLQTRLDRHYRFWRMEETDRPVVSFSLGSYFFAQRFEAAAPLLVHNKEILPEMINPKDFLADYERQYQESLETGQDAFWVAEPFAALPWMEGMLGCKIYGAEESFWVEATLKDWDDLDKIARIEENPWFKKYLEFIEVLVEHSNGRFPVGQPILRGPSDMAGTLRGQSQFIMDLYDRPDQVKKLLAVATNAFLKVIGIGPKQILFTDFSFIFVSVYIFIPFMILPIFSALEKLNPSLVEAAFDLGASPWVTFRRVIFPLTLGGVKSGVQAVFIPSLSLFMITRLIAGNRVITLGTAIEQHFLVTQDWGMGSALAIFLVIAMGLTMWFTESGRRVK